MFTSNFHTGFSLALIALALGAGLLILVKKEKGFSAVLTKIIAYVVIVIAAINLFCLGSGAVKQMHKRHFNKRAYQMMAPKQLGNKMKQHIGRADKKSTSSKRRQR